MNEVMGWIFLLLIKSAGSNESGALKQISLEIRKEFAFLNATEKVITQEAEARLRDLQTLKRLRVREIACQNNITLLEKYSQAMCRERRSISEILKLRQSNGPLEVGEKLRDRWLIEKKLAEGAFGKVFLALDCENEMNEVALKVESLEGNPLKLLRVDSSIIKRFQHSPHCPRLYGMGEVKGKYMYLVMELLGPDLHTLRRNTIGSVLPVPMAFGYYRQGIEALHDFHRMGWIHRDIKPNNLMLGRGERSERVYLIDFGLARRIVEQDGSTRKKRPYAFFRGSLRYASPNIHAGREMGRHDDLWGLTYVLIELVNGTLPWASLGLDKELIGVRKQEISSEDLCISLPPKTQEIVDHIASLSYSCTPDYAWLMAQVDSITTPSPKDETLAENSTAGRTQKSDMSQTQKLPPEPEPKPKPKSEEQEKPMTKTGGVTIHTVPQKRVLSLNRPVPREVEKERIEESAKSKKPSVKSIIAQIKEEKKKRDERTTVPAKKEASSKSKRPSKRKTR